MQSWLVFGDVRDAHFLDLHRMSQATARAALLERVHYLGQQLAPADLDASHAATMEAAFASAAPTPQPPQLAGPALGPETPEDVPQPAGDEGGSSAGDLVVVVGRGKHSPGPVSDGRAPLKQAVQELCEELGVECREDSSNPGRLVISHSELLALAARTSSRGEQATMMRRMQTRLAGLTAFGFGVTVLASLSLWSAALFS